LVKIKNRKKGVAMELADVEWRHSEAFKRSREMKSPGQFFSCQLEMVICDFKKHILLFWDGATPDPEKEEVYHDTTINTFDKVYGLWLNVVTSSEERDALFQEFIELLTEHRGMIEEAKGEGEEDYQVWKRAWLSGQNTAMDPRLEKYCSPRQIELCNFSIPMEEYTG